MRLFLLPLDLIKFWYLDAPVLLFFYFVSLNKAFFGLFSLPLMFKTFFRPWKNEYRKGLIGFSIFMGMIIKIFFIAGDLVIFAGLLFCEIIFYIVFLAFPFLAIYLAFFKF
jgi:hypothetical protein